MPEKKGIIVQKFGGTSVATPDLIKKVAKRVTDAYDKGYQMVVVVSAMGHTTDELLSLVDKITGDPDPREIDMLLSTGEQITIALLAMAIHALGYKAVSFTGPQVGIMTDKVHRSARIAHINDEKIKAALDDGKIVVVAGFQGSTMDSEITTLGRGGSDTTAVAIAAVLKANACEIFTDVDGVFTTDPRVVKEARFLPRITYDEMLELASMGAKVLHSRSVEIAKNFDVPLVVRSSFNNKPGTLVTKEVKEMEDIVVSGVAFNRDEAKISFLGVPDKPGIAAEIFQSIAEENIIVDMIIQNVGTDQSNDISFTVSKDSFSKALQLAKKIKKKVGAKDVVSDTEIAKVSVVGVGMRTHSGVAARMFRALAKNNINIEMISTSEIKISCIINSKDVDRAVQAIHDEFELGSMA